MNKEKLQTLAARYERMSEAAKYDAKNPMNGSYTRHIYEQDAEDFLYIATVLREKATSIQTPDFSIYGDSVREQEEGRAFELNEADSSLL